MISFVSLTVLFGFTVVFGCLHLLGGGDPTATMGNDDASQGGLAVARLAAAALLPTVLATLTLTPLLAFAHVRELVHASSMAAGGGAAAAAAAGPRHVVGLTKATLLAATAALLAAAVVQLGADGHLDRGRGDVARLNIK